MEFRDTEKQDGSLKIVFNEDEIKTLTKTKCFKPSRHFLNLIIGAKLVLSFFSAKNGCDYF